MDHPPKYYPQFLKGNLESSTKATQVITGVVSILSEKKINGWTEIGLRTLVQSAEVARQTRVERRRGNEDRYGTLWRLQST